MNMKLYSIYLDDFIPDLCSCNSEYFLENRSLPRWTWSFILFTLMTSFQIFALATANTSREQIATSVSMKLYSIYLDDFIPDLCSCNGEYFLENRSLPWWIWSFILFTSMASFQKQTCSASFSILADYMGVFAKSFIHSSIGLIAYSLILLSRNICWNEGSGKWLPLSQWYLVLTTFSYPQNANKSIWW